MPRQLQLPQTPAINPTTALVTRDIQPDTALDSVIAINYNGVLRVIEDMTLRLESGSSLENPHILEIRDLIELTRAQIDQEMGLLETAISNSTVPNGFMLKFLSLFIFYRRRAMIEGILKNAERRAKLKLLIEVRKKLAEYETAFFTKIEDAIQRRLESSSEPSEYNAIKNRIDKLRVLKNKLAELIYQAPKAYITAIEVNFSVLPETYGYCFIPDLVVLGSISFQAYSLESLKLKVGEISNELEVLENKLIQLIKAAREQFFATLENLNIGNQVDQLESSSTVSQDFLD